MQEEHEDCDSHTSASGCTIFLGYTSNLISSACERVSATSHSTEWYGHTETLFKLHYVSANNICLGLPLSVLFILNEMNLLMSSYFGVSVGRCDSVHSRRD